MILKLGISFDLSTVLSESPLSLAIYNKMELSSVSDRLYTRSLLPCFKIVVWTFDSGVKWFVPPAILAIDKFYWQRR